MYCEQYLFTALACVIVFLVVLGINRSLQWHPILYFGGIVFWLLSTVHLLQRSEIASRVFFWKSSFHLFWFVIHPELTFVCGVRGGRKLIHCPWTLSHRLVRLFQHRVLKALPFPFCGFGESQITVSPFLCSYPISIADWHGQQASCGIHSGMASVSMWCALAWGVEITKLAAHFQNFKFAILNKVYIPWSLCECWDCVKTEDQ